MNADGGSLQTTSVNTTAQSAKAWQNTLFAQSYFPSPFGTPLGDTLDEPDGDNEGLGDADELMLAIGPASKSHCFAVL